jgi:hypothetical protein
MPNPRFQPSEHSLAPSCFGDSYALDNGKKKKAGPTNKECVKAASDRKKYLDKMWKANLFSTERANYEKKAEKAAKTLEKCHSTKKKSSAGFSFPNEPPSLLWQMEPTSRPVEVGMNLTGAPDMLIMSAAKGYLPTIALHLEYRAEIAAGLAVLQMVGAPGYEDIVPDALPPFVALTLSAKDNAKLIKLMGGKVATSSSGDAQEKALKVAAASMRKKITSLGKGAMDTAFGIRALYMIKAAALATAAKSMSLMVVSFIPAVGQIVGGIGGAIMAGEAALTQTAVARMSLLVKMGQEQLVKDSAKIAKALGISSVEAASTTQASVASTSFAPAGVSAEALATAAAAAEPAVEAPPAPAESPMLWIGALGAIVLGGVAFLF